MRDLLNQSFKQLVEVKLMIPLGGEQFKIHKQRRL
jgi:hypothetical protein